MAKGAASGVSLWVQTRKKRAAILRARLQLQGCTVGVRGRAARFCRAAVQRCWGAAQKVPAMDSGAAKWMSTRRSRA